jgi:pimeloyl-ACP methyl ester carboxylesterase
MEDHAASDEPLRSVWDDVGGVRVHGRVSVGTVGMRATPIVFVHGLGVSMRYMEPTMALVARAHSVAGLDLPGFGRSGSPGHALSVVELSSALEGWLDARGIGPALFVGNSFGCQVIVDCVAREPKRAVGLVLNAPTMDPAHRTVLGQLRRVIADVPREPLSLAVHVARDYLRAGPLRLLATLRFALADHVEEKLPRIVAPTVVVCGARDPVVTVEWAQQVARLVGIERPGAAGATLEVVADAAHALPYDDPHTFAALIGAQASRAAIYGKS